MKKVSILSLHLGYGGIEKSVCALANILIEKYDVEIATTYKLSEIPAFYLNPKVKIKYLTNNIVPNKEEWKQSIKKVKPIKFAKESYKSISTLSQRKKTMINYIKKCNSDIIISTRDIFNNWLSKYGKTDTYKIGWEHNHHHGNRKYASNLIKRSYKLDALVLVSNSLKEYYEREMTHCRCYCIPNILDEIPSTKSSLEEKRIISIGRLSKEKGFIDLLEIFKKVHKLKTDWRLDIIGDGNEKQTLQQYIDSNNLNENVRLHGYQGKQYINDLLEKSSLYCMTSFTESFGIVLIEAMSYGIPCIAFTSAEGANDLIINKENGYLINNRNKEEYINKIIELIDNKELRIKMGEKGIKTSLKYTSDKVKTKWFELLEKR
jgi:glycosyltransferase involved in cell wall biosynthesis